MSIKNILEEAKRRYPPLEQGSFPAQWSFVIDQSPRVAALTSRRAGKSYACALKLIKFCIENPNGRCVYLGLTRQSAHDVLSVAGRQIHQKYKIPLEICFSAANNFIKFPNGSQIAMMGLNDGDAQGDKLRGQAFKLAVIDESAFYKIDLKRVIEDAIEPTLIDHDGQLVCIGTPGNAHNYFYDITEKTIDPKTGLLKAPGWSVHKWHSFDNPFMALKFKKRRDEKMKHSPGIEFTPNFRQEYFGEWAIDTTNLAYRYDPEKNLSPDLPPGDYVFIMGMDTGYTDSNAWVVLAYSRSSDHAYYIYSYSQPEMYLDQIRAKTEEIARMIKQQYKTEISVYVIDQANKQVVEELKRYSRIPFRPAEKINKYNSQQIMNSDFLTGRIQVVDGTCGSLIDEWKSLTIDRSDPANPHENQRKPNHCADAALYAYRQSRHYTYRAPSYNNLTIDQQLRAKANDRLERRVNNPFWDQWDDE